MFFRRQYPWCNRKTKGRSSWIFDLLL